VTILEKIAAGRRVEIERLKRQKPLDTFIDNLNDLPRPRFKSVLQNTEVVNIIAEIKKGSPSKGVLCPDFNPAALAAGYQQGGAAAISVLTEEKHFFGRFEHLELARQHSDLPLLCKDFVVDRYQLFHAKSVGADAILLIVALHTRNALARHLRLATQIGIDCLVEVHHEDELEVAVDSGAEIIGVNNRDLLDFSVSLETSEQLAAAIPSGIVRVTESGIHTHEDIVRLKQSGYNSFLIGEALVTSPNPVSLLRSLRGV